LVEDCDLSKSKIKKLPAPYWNPVWCLEKQSQNVGNKNKFLWYVSGKARTGIVNNSRNPALLGFEIKML
jgi:hypothetical protein